LKLSEDSSESSHKSGRVMSCRAAWALCFMFIGVEFSLQSTALAHESIAARPPARDPEPAAYDAVNKSLVSLVASTFRWKFPRQCADLPPEGGSHSVNPYTGFYRPRPPAPGPRPPAPELIDRVMAVVGTEVILLSDVIAALRFGLVEVPSGQSDPGAALEPLIERQLQLMEVNRYAPPEPLQSSIDERLLATIARFGSQAAFDRALSEAGLTLDQLRGRIRDNLRIASYREQRFSAALQPSEEDVAAFYRVNEKEFTRNGVLRPFPEVRDEARRRLISIRTDTLIREWIEGLRRRTVVTVLPQLR
jgi:hypothetical protein